METWISVAPGSDDYAISGITIDGVHYQLENQPDMAKSNGWGDLGFLFWWRRK